ncbi:hypothetical protein TIFTF001_013247 [Ficus carica]|uniref:Uncharacterized protein n=1 Tax=Ficus carica TaxID=3494 RepID=A0AA88D4F7_FICCA|nr:hypothetical protein TIFTF001_013247 [Ficus carica]
MDTTYLFLADETICFAGVNISKAIRKIGSYRKFECKSGVELGYLAARVLKKPSIELLSLEKLGGEVGLDIKAVDESAVGHK